MVTSTRSIRFSAVDREPSCDKSPFNFTIQLDEDHDSTNYDCYVEAVSEVMEWCVDQFGRRDKSSGGWDYYHWVFTFWDEKEAIAFKLRWS